MLTGASQWEGNLTEAGKTADNLPKDNATRTRRATQDLLGSSAVERPLSAGIARRFDSGPEAHRQRRNHGHHRTDHWHLVQLSTYRRPECDSDEIPHYVNSGNIDERNRRDRRRNQSGKALIKSLDKGQPLPELRAAGFRRVKRRRVALENSERHTTGEN